MGQPPDWNRAAARWALPFSRVLFATNSGATTRVGVGLAVRTAGVGATVGVTVRAAVGDAVGVLTVGVGETIAGPGLFGGSRVDVVVGEPRRLTSNATRPPTMATATKERMSRRSGDGGAACTPRWRPGCRGGSCSSPGSVTANSQTPGVAGGICEVRRRCPVGGQPAPADARRASDAAA